jgi:hypothetical protein
MHDALGDLVCFDISAARQGALEVLRRAVERLRLSVSE